MCWQPVQAAARRSPVACPVSRWYLLDLSYFQLYYAIFFQLEKWILLCFCFPFVSMLDYEVSRLSF